jgi:transcriptional regulator with XRE-family HTH domain
MDKRYQLNSVVMAERIRRARTGKRLTQAQLAEAIGISTNMVGKLEISLAQPSLKTVLAIANALDVDVNYLVGAEGAQKKQATDLFIESQLQDFDEKDKELIIQIISAVKTYKR